MLHSSPRGKASGNRYCTYLVMAEWEIYREKATKWLTYLPTYTEDIQYASFMLLYNHLSSYRNYLSHHKMAKNNKQLYLIQAHDFIPKWERHFQQL